MNLTSRERLIKTLNHQDPGKVVVDLGSTAITGINATALDTLRKKLGLDERLVKIDEPLQLLGQVEEDLRIALDIDVAPVSNNWNMFGFENTRYKKWNFANTDVLVPEKFNTTKNETGEAFLYPQGDLETKPSAKLPVNGIFFDNIPHQSADYIFDEENANARLDYKNDFAIYTDAQLKTIQETAEYYHKNTDYGLIGGGALCGIGDVALLPGPGLKIPCGIRDVENWLVAHYTMPDYVKEAYEMQLEAGLENAKLYKQAVGGKIQAIIISGTDFGTQRAQFISNDMFREFYSPYFKRINDWVHCNTGWKTFFHTCGSVIDLLDDFYDCGIDILNPVQCSAKGMSAQLLKEKYGEKFTFWGGGVDTQKTLPFGTPQEVYDEVMERLKIFAPGGGFVFNPVHNIQARTPTENILAMFKAIKDYNISKEMQLN